MSSHLCNICFDAHDPYAQTTWWDAVLADFVPDPDTPPRAEDDECGLLGSDGTWVLFLRVPEGKVVKNRVHPCLVPADRSRDEEVDRLRGLGATVVADRRNPDGTGWVVLGDPEGNEFCVLRSDAERAATT